LGQLEFGIYDDYDSVPAAELEQHYGIHGNTVHRLPGQTGAGHPADEDDIDLFVNDDDWVDTDESEEAAEALVEANLNTYTEPVPVPEHNSPFVSDAEMRAFAIMLSQYEGSGYLPAGYGMLRGEWEDGIYPTIQVIPAGRRGSKRMEIGLPDIVWRPRSEVWVRALDIMNQLIALRG
jgi:hypothetical protein